jgi:glycogen phosphorylase
MLEEFIHEPRVAYFSMEIALQNDIPSYAGGLGILAGDTLRSAADLALPLVAVSLVSRGGYFKQEIDSDGWQHEHDAPWEPQQWAQRLDAKIAVPIEGRAVWIAAWFYVLESHLGGRQPVLLLDTDLPENAESDRRITYYLYGDGNEYRLKQEIVLGVGGVRLLRALGFTIRTYHMNEGHSALLGVELLRRFAYAPEELRPGEPAYDIPRVRALCRFTTHTPVEAGHDHFPYELVERILTTPSSVAGFIDLDTLKYLGGKDALNMTQLALGLSEYVNGVSQRHAELARKMMPGYRVHAITNGVHPLTWAAPSFRKLYDEYVPGWWHEPELLTRVDCCIPDRLIWQAHLEAKQALLDRIHALTGRALALERPTLAFARRMTAYKRPDLLFSDVERLKAIARASPFQVILGGKAHPLDQEGKGLIAELHRHARELANSIPIVYLPDYDLAMAQLMVAGVDIWLNTPLPPLEASGTSGMKAAFNGVPSLSVLDGWWLEGCIEGVTGWGIGSAGGARETDAAALYDKLEKVILPLCATSAAADSPWLKIMKAAISKNATQFNSHRMMRRYASEAYLR